MAQSAHPAFHKSTLHVLIILVCSLWAFSSKAQNSNWKIQQISTENGLSNRFVSRIMADSRGFVWIGTNFGLNRYDGHQFDILTKESNGLQSNAISSLYEDVNNNIWVIHRNTNLSPISGVDILDPIGFRIKSFNQYIPNAPDLSVEKMRWIMNDSSHNIYVVTFQNEVFTYDDKGWRLLFQYPEQLSQFSVSSGSFILLKSKQDSVFIVNERGDLLSSLATPEIPNASVVNLNGWKIMGAISPGKEVFATTDENRFAEYYTILGSGGFTPIKKIPLHGEKLYTIGLDPYRQKIITIEALSNKITMMDVVSGERESVPVFLINCNFSYTDSIGLTWTNSADGITIVSKPRKYFSSHLVEDVPLYSCRSFTEGKDGLMYLLTNGGNFIFHPDTKQFEKLDLKRELVGLASMTTTDGHIWFAGEYLKIFRYSPTTGAVKDWNFPYYPYFAMWSLLQIKSGEILIGSNNGLWLKDPNDDAKLPVQFSKLNGYDILNQSTIYHMLETDEGIWICTDNGLFLVDLEKGILEYIDEESAGLPTNNLLYLHIDSDDVFWLATRGGGIIRWDRQTRSFRSYTVKEGLSHNIIYAIFEDDYGFFWMPSDFGLMRFEKSTGLCRTFLKPEGIPHEEFNRTSYFEDSKGNYYFGGLNGFLTFNPKDMLDVKSISLPVHLTKFEAVNEKNGTIEDLTLQAATGQIIHLDPTISSFTIHYSILDYDDPLLKRYAYYIEGLNANWNYLTENFIRINGLKGGTYKIHIKGQSTSGQWSENELVIPVHIAKPFFARIDVQLILLLLAGGMIYMFFRRHKANLKREMAVSHQLRQVDKLKDQFLANTSHELRTPLNGIVGLSESLLEKIQSTEEKEDLELIISSGRRLSNLVNDILDFSRLKEHDLQLNLKAVNIASVADLCIRMNRHIVHGKDLQFKVDISPDISYCLADENRLQQILQNLVANAIKFTREGMITIQALEAGGMIVTSVSDTGIGIAKEKLHTIFREFEQADGSISREYGGTGLGLSITKYLVELHGGTISVISEPGHGSTFTFTVPVWKGVKADIPEKSKDISIAVHDREYASGTTSGTEVKSNGFSSKIGPVIDKHSKHILIVDDEMINLKVLRNHLEHEGYVVTQANDGEQALELVAKEHSFALVLLDVMMPRITGYEVCQRIRERYLPGELPVIMVTAKNQVNDLVEGLAIGANDYIVKPFSKDELLARVKTQLDNHDFHIATNRFVPHEFIHSLGRQNIMDLHRGDMVEQNVHVMFSDIRDYTTLAEDMTPVENFNFVNKLAGRVGPIVKNNHGMVNQYLGDTIMMLFMDKAADGVQAGIDILQMIAAYNLKRKKKNQKIIKLGIGMHSGPLIMGIIGDDMRTDAAVISDTVNTASRMEGLTKFYNVNFVLSADTVDKLDDPERFSLRYLGKVKAKGKMHATGVYECFDGDPPDTKKMKAQTLELFHKAQDAYFAKDLDAALAYFSTVYQANPADTTVLGFLNRVHIHMGNGVGDDWTGVELMEVK